MQTSLAFKIIFFLSIVFLFFSCSNDKVDHKDLRKGNLTIEAYLQIDTAKPYLQQVIRYDSLKKRIETTWYEADGKIARVSKPIYNELGQMTIDERIAASREGKVSKETWKYNYNQAGLVSEVMYIVNGDTMDTEYIYDSNKRLQKEINAKSSEGFWKGNKTYHYEKEKVTKIKNYQLDNTEVDSYDSIVISENQKEVYTYSAFMGGLYDKRITTLKKGKPVKESHYSISGGDSLVQLSDLTFTYNDIDSVETKSKTRFESNGSTYPAKTMTFKYVYIWK